MTEHQTLTEEKTVFAQWKFRTGYIIATEFPNALVSSFIFSRTFHLL